MFAANLVKDITRRASASVGYVIEPLTDAFLCISAGGNVEQTLIGSGVPHDSLRLPLHRKHHGALALFKLFHEVAGSAAEGRQRLSAVDSTPPNTKTCIVVSCSAMAGGAKSAEVAPSCRFTTCSHARSSAQISRRTLLRFAADATERFISIFNVDYLLMAHSNSG
jgi:hypothetical protein